MPSFIRTPLLREFYHNTVNLVKSTIPIPVRSIYSFFNQCVFHFKQLRYSSMLLRIEVILEPSLSTLYRYKLQVKWSLIKSKIQKPIGPELLSVSISLIFKSTSISGAGFPCALQQCLHPIPEPGFNTRVFEENWVRVFKPQNPGTRVFVFFGVFSIILARTRVIC